MQKQQGRAGGRGRLGHVAARGLPVHGGVLWTGGRLGGGPGPPVHGGPATRALSRGPWWTARGARRAAGPRQRDGQGRRRHGRRRELAVAAMRGTRRLAKGTGVRGLTRRARWRAYLRKTTKARRSSTAAARIRRARRRRCELAARDCARVSRGVRERRLGAI